MRAGATALGADGPVGALRIDHLKLRHAMDAPRQGRVLRLDVDRVARRVADDSRP